MVHISWIKLRRSRSFQFPLNSLKNTTLMLRFHNVSISVKRPNKNVMTSFFVWGFFLTSSTLFHGWTRSLFSVILSPSLIFLFSWCDSLPASHRLLLSVYIWAPVKNPSSDSRAAIEIPDLPSQPVISLCLHTNIFQPGYLSGAQGRLQRRQVSHPRRIWDLCHTNLLYEISEGPRELTYMWHKGNIRSLFFWYMWQIMIFYEASCTKWVITDPGLCVCVDILDHI